MLCTSTSSGRVGVGGWAVRRSTDIKTKEAVDDNGDAERGASRAEIRWCFVDVLKIRCLKIKKKSVTLFHYL